MVFRHVKLFAIAQQVELDVGDSALGLHPESEGLEVRDVRAIGSGLEGAPVPPSSRPFFPAAFELILHRRVATVSFNRLGADGGTFRVGPSGSLGGFFTVPHDDPLHRRRGFARGQEVARQYHQ